eukprot:TRINITY_DN9989_c0_g1_i2.p1 TRINITY_DN9989_c0_g1~~TRINITY_DN9989_c0_g1_i2.p1  ORF type:complete len:1687 (+),score=468.21 TRINITY_DN9989_c0_g1_i2:144-5063(+)
MPPDVSEKLAFLDRMADQLLREGNEIEHAKARETALLLRRAHGEPLAELQQEAERLVADCNSIGVRHFKGGAYDTALYLLRKALMLTAGAEAPDTDCFAQGADGRLRLRAVTYNNLGCLEKKRGDFELALKYLRSALDIERTLEDTYGQPAAAPATAMNLCAVLTKLGRQHEALVEAERAVRCVVAQRQRQPERTAPGPTADNHLLVVAYHNLAVAQEFAEDPQTAAKAYGTYAMASEVANAELGPGHATTKSVESNRHRFRTQTAPQRGLSVGGVPAMPAVDTSRMRSPVTAPQQQQLPPPTQAQLLPTPSPTPPPADGDWSPQKAEELLRGYRAAGAGHKATPRRAVAEAEGGWVPPLPREATAPPHQRGTERAARRPSRPRPPPQQVPLKAPSTAATVYTVPPQPPHPSPRSLAQTHPPPAQPQPPPPAAEPPFRRSAPGRGRGKRRHSHEVAEAFGTPESGSPASSQRGTRPKAAGRQPAAIVAGAPAAAGGPTVSSAAMLGTGGLRIDAATARHQERMLARRSKRVALRDRENRQRALARKIFEREKQEKMRREEEQARQQREEMARIMYERMCAGLRAEEAKKYRAAARKIQRVYRGYLARDMIARCEAACITIQALVRSHQSRTRERRRREQELIDRAEQAQQNKRVAATVRIQRRARHWFANRQMARIKQAKLLRRRYCARRIQRAWRYYRAAMEREVMQRELELREAEEQRQAALHNAACTIQAFWRGFATRARFRVLREEQEARRNAASTIQKRIRGMLARKVVRTMRRDHTTALQTTAQRTAAGIKIQYWFRCVIARAELAHRRTVGAAAQRRRRLHKAACRIQRAFRCYRSRQFARVRRRMRHLRVERATMIQRAWRCRLARVEADRRRAARQKQPAARVIQGEWRSAQERQELKETAEYHNRQRQIEKAAERRTAAAITLQAWARGNAGRRIAGGLRAEALRRRRAAVTIQCCARQMFARKRMRHMCALRDRVLASEERDRLRDEAARKLQREMRAWLARRNIASRRLREGGALRIQCRYREHHAKMELQRRRKARDDRIRDKAARKIQGMVRNTLRRAELRRLEEYYSGVQRRKLLAMRQEEAAISIQALFRGYTGRREARRRRKELNRRRLACRRIQKCFRTYVRRKKTSAVLLERAGLRARKLKAAVAIQSFWRMILSQEFVQMLREDHAVRSEAATSIQCWWRRLAAQAEAQRRRKVRAEAGALRSRMAEAAERGILLVQGCARSKCAGLSRLELQAALLRRRISENRGYVDSLQQGAAVRIQAQWRAHSDRQYVRGLRLERRERRRREAAEAKRRTQAATKIQAAQRQRVARKEAAVRRQRRAEEAAARQREYEEAEGPEDVVQQLFWELEARSGRRLLRERQQREEQRFSAARSIQCQARKMAAKRETHGLRQLKLMHRGARVIQREWLNKSARLAAQLAARRLAAAVRIQAFARGTAGRKRARAARTQRDERVRNALRDEELVDSAVVMLQSFWRSVAARRLAATIHAARASRREAHNKREAATFIQRSWRGLQGRRRAQQRRENRRRSMQEDANRKMHPANSDCSRYGGPYKGRRHSALQREEAATKIQCMARGRAARQAVGARRSAVQEQQTELKQEQAAGIIQQAWRRSSSAEGGR